MEFLLRIKWKTKQLAATFSLTKPIAEIHHGGKASHQENRQRNGIKLDHSFRIGLVKLLIFCGFDLTDH